MYRIVTDCGSFFNQQHHLINKTLNITLNNIEYCFVMLLTQFHVKCGCKNWHYKILNLAPPQK